MSVSAFNVFTEAEAAEILELNKEFLSAAPASGKHRVGFTLPTDALQKLSTALDLPIANPVPAQIVTGETVRHVDVGTESFDNTHLVYLTESEGALVIGDERYPIQPGAGYVFSQGLSHGTEGAHGTRVSLGPFNEHQRYVGGGYGTYYIYTEGSPNAYVLGPSICGDLSGGYTILAYNAISDVAPAGYTFVGWSTSDPPTNVDYAVGDTGLCAAISGVNLYPVFVNCNNLPPVTQPYRMDNTTLTEITKDKVLLSSAPNPLQNYSSSRTERLKAKILASKCCNGC
jgi:hypothetical protein